MSVSKEKAKGKRKRISRKEEAWYTGVQKIVLLEEWAKLLKKEVADVTGDAMNDARFQARREVKDFSSEEFCNYMLDLLSKKKVVEEEEDDDNECPICLDNVFSQNNGGVMLCNHCNQIYHQACLLRCQTCPTCRGVINIIVE